MRTLIIDRSREKEKECHLYPELCRVEEKIKTKEDVKEEEEIQILI